jgi:hypothetical protein
MLTIPAFLPHTLFSSSLPSKLFGSVSLCLGFSNSFTLLSVLLCCSFAKLVLTLWRLSLRWHKKTTVKGVGVREWCYTGTKSASRRNSKRNEDLKRRKTKKIDECMNKSWKFNTKMYTVLPIISFICKYSQALSRHETLASHHFSIEIFCFTNCKTSW